MGSRPRSRGRADQERDRSAESENPVNPLRLGALIRERGGTFGPFILIVDRVDSTNALASHYQRLGVPHGSIFIGREQTAGRGRWGRAWKSQPGGLYLSLALRPDAAHVRHLPLTVAVAAAEHLRERFSIDVRLHWPNDLFASAKKLGGFLCEASFTGGAASAIVGIGVNVNQTADAFTDLDQPATSIRDLTGELTDEIALASGIVVAIERWCSRGDDVVEAWTRWADGASDTRVRVTARSGDGFDATTAGVTADGGLNVVLDSGERRVIYGDDVLYIR